MLRNNFHQSATLFEVVAKIAIQSHGIERNMLRGTGKDVAVPVAELATDLLLRDLDPYGLQGIADRYLEGESLDRISQESRRPRVRSVLQSVENLGPLKR